MARPTKNNPNGEQISPKLTPDTVHKLEEAFALDATVGEACFYADISRTTYYEWIKNNPELADKFERLREKPVLLARESVVKALKTDPELSLKYLERKRRSEFATKVENENTGNITVVVKDNFNKKK